LISFSKIEKISCENFFLIGSFSGEEGLSGHLVETADSSAHRPQRRPTLPLCHPNLIFDAGTILSQSINSTEDSIENDEWFSHVDPDGTAAESLFASEWR
jgi:hypothetical protein